MRRNQSCSTFHKNKSIIGERRNRRGSRDVPVRRRTKTIKKKRASAVRYKMGPEETIAAQTRTNMLFKGSTSRAGVVVVRRILTGRSARTDHVDVWLRKPNMLGGGKCHKGVADNRRLFFCVYARGVRYCLITGGNTTMEGLICPRAEHGITYGCSISFVKMSLLS